MESDLVLELAMFGGFENIVTAIDVFSCYSFAYPISLHDAKAVTKINFNKMTKHACRPKTFIFDKRSAFISHVIKEVAGVPRITPKHATAKHAQTIDKLDRSHASIKQALNIEIGERRSIWRKYVNTAVLNYNTCYHASFGCKPGTVFHGRVPYNVLGLKMGVRLQKMPTPNSQFAKDSLEQIVKVSQDGLKNAMQAFIRYKM